MGFDPPSREAMDGHGWTRIGRTARYAKNAKRIFDMMNKIDRIYVLSALQSVQIPQFVEDFHAAIPGFGAVALFVYFAWFAVVKNARILYREIRQIRENVLF
jgi:hypothetical protein